MSQCSVIRHNLKQQRTAIIGQSLYCTVRHTDTHTDRQTWLKPCSLDTHRPWQTDTHTDKLSQTNKPMLIIACSHRWHRQHKTYSLFTPLTQTTQDKTVLFCLCQRCEHNCRQDERVLSCLDPVLMSCVVLTQFPICNCSSLKIYWRLLKNWKFWKKLGRDKTKLGRDKTKLSCVVLSSLVFTLLTRQDKTLETVLSCPCRRCEQAIRHTLAQWTRRRQNDKWD